VARDADGNNALHFGDRDIVRKVLPLVDEFPDGIHVRNDAGETPLHTNVDPLAVATLLSAGVPPDVQVCSFVTAL
jgi:hypothetical protein